jgi:hypothetical protein
MNDQIVAKLLNKIAVLEYQNAQLEVQLEAANKEEKNSVKK